MIDLSIPGRGLLSIENAVFDVNGTLAKDGVIPDHLFPALEQLASHVSVYLLTADTYGTIAPQVEKLPVGLFIVRQPGEGEQKADFIRRLGAEKTAVFGNGANDALMFEAAALSFAVLNTEGCFTGLLTRADLLLPSPSSAVEILLNPTRLIASLRR